MMIILILIAKLGLQSAQQVRLLRSCMVVCPLVSADHELVKAMKSSTLEYFNKSKIYKDVAARQAAISVPHAHAWNACLRWLLKDNLSPLHKECLEKYIKTASELKNGLKFFEKHVQLAKVSKAFERQLVKLEFNVVYN